MAETERLLLVDLLTEAPAQRREEQERYLLSLLSFGLDKVSSEPERLAKECATVKKETESHAVNNYSAFLQSAVGVRNVREELEHSGRLLHEIAAEVPKLQEACAKVSETARTIELERKDIHITSKQHNQLLELLEVPQLMDTAVRNEYYDEALELAEFANKLRRKHADIPLLKTLQESVDESQGYMQQQLLLKLQTNIQLPVCLHVIGVLRRLGKHSDEQLRFMFLQCRDKWLQNAFDEVTNASMSVYGQLCKITDLVRMHMFEIVTQYRAIFLDFSSGHEEDVASDGGLLFAWANRRICFFVAMLERGLPKLKEGSQIASVLEKVMYCGAYLGREGLDFRGAVSTAFENRVLMLVQHGLSIAQETFDQVLLSYKGAQMPESVKARYEEPVSGVLSPPVAILDFLPLAVLCNKVMDVFNELRECAIISIRLRVTVRVSALLSFCTDRTSSLFSDQEESFSKEERSRFVKLMKAMTEHFVPFVAECVKSVFLAQHHEMDLPKICLPLKEVIDLEEEAERKVAEAIAKRKAEEEEARRKIEEEARRKEEEARAQAEEEARLKAEEEARIKAEEEARIKAEEEAKIKAEEDRIRAEEERVRAENEAAAEAKVKAEQEAMEAQKAQDETADQEEEADDDGWNTAEWKD